MATDETNNMLGTQHEELPADIAADLEAQLSPAAEPTGNVQSSTGNVQQGIETPELDSQIPVDKSLLNIENSGGKAAGKRRDLPDLVKQAEAALATPDADDGETKETLRQKLADALKERDDARNKYGSMAGRLKKRGEEDGAGRQELMARIEELEQRLSDRDADPDADDGEEDGLHPGARKAVERMLASRMDGLDTTLEELRGDNARLREITERERAAVFNSRVLDAHDDAAEVFNSPEWAAYLKTQDRNSRRPVGALVVDAVKARDAEWLSDIVGMFKETQRLPVETDPKVRAKMRPANVDISAKPKEAPGPRTYTWKEYNAFTTQWMRDPSLAKDPKAAALYKDMDNAVMEGRIVEE